MWGQLVFLENIQSFCSGEEAPFFARCYQKLAQLEIFQLSLPCEGAQETIFTYFGKMEFFFHGGEYFILGLL